MNDMPTYNYDTFTRANVAPLMRFAESPAIGAQAPDFPLWNLDGTETRLRTIWSEHLHTIVEFGSFT